MRADEILQAFLPSPVLNAGFEFREFHLYDRLAILIADMDAVRPESIPDCHRFSAEFQMRQLGHQLRSLPLTMQCMEAKNIDTSVRFYMRSMKAFAKMAQTVNTAVRNSVFLEHCDLLVQADDILITFKQDDAFRGRTVTRQGEVLHVGRLMMSIDRRAIHLQRALRLGFPRREVCGSVCGWPTLRRRGVREVEEWQAYSRRALLPTSPTRPRKVAGLAADLAWPPMFLYPT